VGNGVLKAGCGFGGSCLEKDARAIISVARERKSGLGILEKALEVNGRMPLEVVKLLSRRHMEGRNIGVLGLAFKAGTDDLRNSRSVAVINELRKINCTVAAYDPNLGADAPGLPPGIIFCDGPQVLVERSDAVLVMTEWDGFAELDYGDKVVIDTKGVVPKIKRSRNYEGICWP
jgi:nucleotide sugar dehydrogenase